MANWVSMMMSMANLFHHSVETIVFVGGIFNNAVSAIGFFQGVFSLDDISVSLLPLTFMVASLWIFYSILEFVGRVTMVILMIIVSVIWWLLMSVIWWLLMPVIWWLVMSVIWWLVMSVRFMTVRLSSMSMGFTSLMWPIVSFLFIVNWMLHFKLKITLWVASWSSSDDNKGKGELKKIQIINKILFNSGFETYLDKVHVGLNTWNWLMMS